jgi:metallo-beta-lactamase class B
MFSAGNPHSALPAAPHNQAMRPAQNVLAILALVCCLPAYAAPNPDWTTPLAPFQIADNLYYVGSRDLASYLVITPAGNILINSNLESSPPLIKSSVEKLGFRWTDIKILLNGQAHYDHMAGAAEILRETHALNMVMQGDVDSISTGGRKDFSVGMEGIETFPPAPVDRILHDGDTVELGGVVLTAHLTAGHTRGCTTWTFRAHIPGDAEDMQRNIVIVGGFSPLSTYILAPRPGHPASYPGIAADFNRTFSTLRALPCDVFLGAHGVYFNMLAKLQRSETEGRRVWIDPQGYKAAIDSAERDFNAMLTKQQSTSYLR